MIMTFSMTRFTQSYTIRDFVPQIWIRGERLDVVRVQFNGCPIAFMVMCATVLTGVIVSPVNSLAPLFVFWLFARYFILMGFIYMTLILIFTSQNPRRFSDRVAFHTTREGAVFSFSALLLVFRHQISAIQAWGSYLHAVIADTFRIGLLLGLETITTDKARLTNAACVGVSSGRTGYTVSRRWFIEFGDCREWFAAIGAWRKIGLIAGWADSIIARVISAYSTSILHGFQYTTNHPITQLERMSTAFPALEIKRLD